MTERYKSVGIVDRVIKTYRKEMPVAPAKYRPPLYGDVTLGTTPNPLIKSARESELWLPQSQEVIHWESESLQVEVILGEKSDTFSLQEHLTMLAFSYSTDEYYPVKSYLVRGLKSGVTLQLLGNEQANYKIFWTQKGYINGLNQQGFQEKDSRISIFSPNIAHPGAMVVALHEIGHYYSLMQTKRNKSVRVKSLSNAHVAIRSNLFTSSDELELVLHEERAAWSYALAKLRPFIRAGDWSVLNTQTVSSMVHEVALNSYHHDIARKIRIPPSLFS